MKGLYNPSKKKYVTPPETPPKNREISPYDEPPVKNTYYIKNVYD